MRIASPTSPKLFLTLLLIIVPVVVEIRVGDLSFVVDKVGAGDALLGIMAFPLLPQEPFHKHLATLIQHVKFATRLGIWHSSASTVSTTHTNMTHLDPSLPHIAHPQPTTPLPLTPRGILTLPLLTISPMIWVIWIYHQISITVVRQSTLEMEHAYLFNTSVTPLFSQILLNFIYIIYYMFLTLQKTLSLFFNFALIMHASLNFILHISLWRTLKPRTSSSLGQPVMGFTCFLP